MTLYFDSNIKCILFLKNKETIEYDIKWFFLIKGFLAFIYNKFNQDWLYVDTYYESGDPCGRLKNDEVTVSLIDKELKKSDFDAIVLDNFSVDCELYLKSEPSNPRFYTVTKEDLMNNFIKEMYDLHGNDWQFFDTYFSDSEENAYGRIVNDSYRRKNNKLTHSGLKQKRWNVNKDKWAGEFIEQNERFYVLFFTDGEFIKIGHTYRKFEYRLYNYIFPYSDKEIRIYKDLTIDFEKSFLIETTRILEDIKSKNEIALEEEIKQVFKNRTHSNKNKFGNSREILEKDCFTELELYIKDKITNEKKWTMKTLFEYTGFKNNHEMKEFNLKHGVTEKTNKFYSRGMNPTIYLK